MLNFNLTQNLIQMSERIIFGKDGASCLIIFLCEFLQFNFQFKQMRRLFVGLEKQFYT